MIDKVRKYLAMGFKKGTYLFYMYLLMKNLAILYTSVTGQHGIFQYLDLHGNIETVV